MRIIGIPDDLQGPLWAYKYPEGIFSFTLTDSFIAYGFEMPIWSIEDFFFRKYYVVTGVVSIHQEVIASALDQTI